MAIDFNTQTMLSNERKLVIQFRAKSDGSDALSATTIVTPSNFTSTSTGKTCSYVSIDRIWASNGGGCITELFWNASTTDYLIMAYGNTGSTSSSYYHDFTIGGWGGLRPPGLGNTTISSNTGGDDAGAGTVDGIIQISIRGVGSNDSVTVVIEGTKHYG